MLQASAESVLSNSTAAGHTPGRRRPQHLPRVTERLEIRADHSRTGRDARSRVRGVGESHLQHRRRRGDLTELFRKDLIIELHNEQAVVAKAYKVYRCWVSEYQALPELDANAMQWRSCTWCCKTRMGARHCSAPTNTNLNLNPRIVMVVEDIPLRFARTGRVARLRELTGRDEYAVSGASSADALRLLDALLDDASRKRSRADPRSRFGSG